MPNGTQGEVQARPIARPIDRCAKPLLFLAGLLALCVLGREASSEPPELSVVAAPVVVDVPQVTRPCLGGRAEEGELSAIYLDLDSAMASDGLFPNPDRGRRWFCADTQAPGVSHPSDSRSLLDIELIALDSFALALTLESAAGEIWEIEFARTDGEPLEAAAFVSDGMGFFINRIEWGDEGEITEVDVDFEVDLEGGDSLWGRLLWSAPWNPDEAPFVPLSPDEWQNARPGVISIEGPALDRLFSVEPRLIQGLGTEGVSTSATTSLVDSANYSREPAASPEAAKEEVAEDVAKLPESQRVAVGSTRGNAKRESAAPSVTASGSVFAGSLLALRRATEVSAAWESRTHVPPQSGHGYESDPQTPSIDPELELATGDDLEPEWLDEANPTVGFEDADVERATSSPGSEACPLDDGDRIPVAGVRELPRARCMSRVTPGEGIPGREGSDAADASPEYQDFDRAEEHRHVVVSEAPVQREDLSARVGSPTFVEKNQQLLQPTDRAGAAARGSESGDFVYLRRLIEDWSLALRNVAARSWQAVKTSVAVDYR